MGFLDKFKHDKKGASSVEALIGVAIAVSALIMIGIYLLSQLAVSATTNIAALDANSQRNANLAVQGTFSMINTLVPITAAVITILLLAIAFAVVKSAISSGDGHGGGYQM